MAFPPGITVVGATLDKGRVRVSVFLSRPLPSPWRISAEKLGVALTTSIPPVRRAVTPGKRGTREAQPRSAFPQPTREIRVVPCLMRGFGKVPDHNGEGSAL